MLHSRSSVPATDGAVPTVASASDRSGAVGFRPSALRKIVSTSCGLVCPRAARCSAPRWSSVASVAPFWSSSSWSVVGGGCARRDHLFTVRTAERSHQRIRRHHCRTDAKRRRGGVRAHEREVERAFHLLLPDAGDGAHRVHELLSSQPPERGPLEHVRLRTLREIHGNALVRARREDHADGPLDVVAVRDQILGQPVEQVRLPGGLIHVVHGFDETSSHEPRPQTIDDGAR